MEFCPEFPEILLGLPFDNIKIRKVVFQAIDEKKNKNNSLSFTFVLPKGVQTKSGRIFLKQILVLVLFLVFVELENI